MENEWIEKDEYDEMRPGRFESTGYQVIETLPTEWPEVSELNYFIATMLGE